jgi:hypothetical protein
LRISNDGSMFVVQPLVRGRHLDLIAQVQY